MQLGWIDFSKEDRQKAMKQNATNAIVNRMRIRR